MKKILFSILLLSSISVLAVPSVKLNGLSTATPFVNSDVTTQIVTACGVVLDSAPEYDSPVVGNACHIDISSITPGSHTIKASFVNVDPVWGRSESVFSLPLVFVRPAQTLGVAPANIVISPK